MLDDPVPPPSHRGMTVRLADSATSRETLLKSAEVRKVITRQRESRAVLVSDTTCATGSRCPASLFRPRIRLTSLAHLKWQESTRSTRDSRRLVRKRSKRSGRSPRRCAARS